MLERVSRLDVSVFGGSVLWLRHELPGHPPHYEVSSRPFVRNRVERKRKQQRQPSVAQARRSDRKGHDASR